MISARNSFKTLKLWQRVPVRLTLIYGLALLSTLTPAAYFIYRLAVDAELDNLSSRIRATTVSLSTMVDPASLGSIDDAQSPYRVALVNHFQAILEQAPELASIYIFAPTERPETMRFIVDVDNRREPASFGETYDAGSYPQLMAGVRGPTVEREPVADDWGFSLSGFAPIRGADGQTLGILGVDVPAARIEQAETRLLHIALAVYSGVLVLLVFGALGVARILRRPLTRIITATDDIAANRLATRVGDLGRNEFGVLGRHFDDMAKGLEEREHIRKTFGRYVSDEVARKLIAEDKAGGVFGEERIITVLFSDLRGYSTISENLAPTDVLRIMNEYLELMNRIITSQGGCIIEYMGDGILAVFGAPDDLPDQATHATRSALAMRDGLDALNDFWDKNGTSAAWKSRGLERLTARIGLHKGRVVAGSLGSSLRMKYTLLGDTVNIAARIERLNTELGSNILMSREVFTELPEDLQKLATPRGEHRVKGRSNPVEVLSI